jgi:hypothetical protein
VVSLTKYYKHVLKPSPNITSINGWDLITIPTWLPSRRSLPARTFEDILLKAILRNGAPAPSITARGKSEKITGPFGVLVM